MRPVDFLQLGLGAAFLAKDKIESLLKEMEHRGEISREEIEKFVESAKTRAEREREELDARIQAKVKDVVKELGLATKEDIAELKKLLKKA